LKAKVECGVDASYQRAADIEVCLPLKTNTMRGLNKAQVYGKLRCKEKGARKDSHI